MCVYSERVSCWVNTKIVSHKVGLYTFGYGSRCRRQGVKVVLEKAHRLASKG